jgi:hypothetical protein
MRSTWQGWGSIEKVEERADGSIIVTGVASHAGVVDSQGEVVTAMAMRDAIPDYMRWAPIREMHGNVAAGTALEMYVDRQGVTRLKAHIVDPVAVLKVKTKTYKGFSIGGRGTRRNAADPSIIEGLSLAECSLVDRPANPAAILTAWKAERAAEAVAALAVEKLKAEAEPTDGEAQPHHRGKCEKCGATLVCIACHTAVRAEAESGKLAKLAASLAERDASIAKIAGERDAARQGLKLARAEAAGLRKALGERDVALGAVMGERDAANEALKRNARGYVRDMSGLIAVEKVADGRGGPMPEPEPEDDGGAVRRLILKAHRNPLPSDGRR